MKVISHIQKNATVRILAVLVILTAINFASSKLYWRIDLTQDKRFTLSNVTHSTLEKIHKPLTFKVYLDKDVNPGFRHLYQSLGYMLREMQTINSAEIKVEMIQPDALKGKEKKAFSELCEKHNMLPVNIVEQDNAGKMSQIAIYPWMLISYDNKELPIQLLQNLPGRSGEENLNISIENMEYQILDGVRILSISESERIAFLEGHGEWNEDEVYDLTTALSRYFSVDRGRIGNSAEILKPYKAVIIAGPKKPFSEEEKFILDQYIMQGGKVLWFLDGVNISADSLRNASATLGLYNNLNLEDMLFTYGVRINPDLVMDLQCARYPVNVAPMGSAPDFKPMPWYYAPVFTSSNRHPISKNINPVKGEFVSTLIMVSQKNNVDRTLLLTTGKQTQLVPTPALVSMDIVMQDQDVNQYNQSYQPVAVLLEGEFTSAFLNRFPPNGVVAKDIQSISKPTKMLVVADGDLPRNDVQQVGGNRRIYPLGFDKITGRELYGNKAFILNAVNFMTEESGILELRNRTIPIRLLDKEKANSRRFVWQIINLGIPLLVVLIFAFINGFIRRKKYA